MSFFKPRVAQIKFVKETPDGSAIPTVDAINNVREYAEIVKDVAGELTTMAIVLIVTKSACDIAKILAKKI